MKKIILHCWLLFAMGNATAQNIVQAEYFIDTDLGFGNNNLVDLAAAPSGSFSVPVNLSNTSPGYHLLFTRFKDSDGNWGFTSRRVIEVIPAEPANLVNGEYFFDTDPGYAAANPLSISPQGNVVLQNFTAVTAALGQGYHKLYLRLKDSDGKWGLTSRRNMEQLNLTEWEIKTGEYFFNTDPGFGNGLPLQFEAAQPGNSFTFNIPLENIPTGTHTLYLRVRDSSNQNWSITRWQSDSVVTSIKSGLWSDVNTWSNHKIPVSGTVVILHHDVIVDIDAFCRSLTPYRNNVIVTVNQDKVLKITGH